VKSNRLVLHRLIVQARSFVKIFPRSEDLGCNAYENGLKNEYALCNRNFFSELKKKAIGTTV